MQMWTKCSQKMITDFHSRSFIKIFPGFIFEFENETFIIGKLITIIYQFISKTKNHWILAKTERKYA
jgi:hypothetical protein